MSLVPIKAQRDDGTHGHTPGQTSEDSEPRDVGTISGACTRAVALRM
jgi:hypothetical protein